MAHSNWYIRQTAGFILKVVFVNYCSGNYDVAYIRGCVKFQQLVYMTCTPSKSTLLYQLEISAYNFPAIAKCSRKIACLWSNPPWLANLIKHHMDASLFVAQKASHEKAAYATRLWMLIDFGTWLIRINVFFSPDGNTSISITIFYILRQNFLNRKCFSCFCQSFCAVHNFWRNICLNQRIKKLLNFWTCYGM